MWKSCESCEDKLTGSLILTDWRSKGRITMYSQVVLSIEPIFSIQRKPCWYGGWKLDAKLTNFEGEAKYFNFCSSLEQANYTD